MAIFSGSGQFLPVASQGRGVYNERRGRSRIMKVEGPSRTQNAEQAKKKSKVGSGDGSFGQMVMGGAQETGASAATQSIATIDTLLALQTVDDPAARAAKKRMRQRAEGVLKELENIRTALLTGTLTVGHIIDIADVVASHREKIMDPRLTGILDEIDLRAQVEIAKMRMALDQPQ